MAFSELGRALDVEWFLKRDETRSAADLARQDEALTCGAPPSLNAVLDQWLQGRRAAEQHRTLGTRVSELLSATHLLLIAVSLAVGSATAESLLFSADPKHPTNILTFLFATWVWPLLFLLFSLVALSVRGRLGGSIVLAELYAWLVSLLDRLSQRATHSQWSVMQDWRALRRQQQRYRDIELASLACATQWYALSFHMGAALSLLRSALFSDLTFAWSTTNNALEWDTLATTFAVLTAPWCQTTGSACVSPQLVQATEFVRFTAQYAATNGAELSGAWWSPLFLCLVAYGALPRLVLSLALRRFVVRRSSNLGERIVELRRRLQRGVSVARQPTSGPPDGAPGAPAPGRPVRARSLR